MLWHFADISNHRAYVPTCLCRKQEKWSTYLHAPIYLHVLLSQSTACVKGQHLDLTPPPGERDSDIFHHRCRPSMKHEAGGVCFPVPLLVPGFGFPSRRSVSHSCSNSAAWWSSHCFLFCFVFVFGHVPFSPSPFLPFLVQYVGTFLVHYVGTFFVHYAGTRGQ